MSSIEEKALALASEWERSFVTPSEVARRRALVKIFTMLVTEQEAHEADKQAFSDAVEEAVKACGHDGLRASYINNMFGRFIIKKPDPLVEAFDEIHGHSLKEGETWSQSIADRLRAALAGRGLGVARIGEVVEGPQS